MPSVVAPARARPSRRCATRAGERGEAARERRVVDDRDRARRPPAARRRAARGSAPWFSASGVAPRSNSASACVVPDRAASARVVLAAEGDGRRDLEPRRARRTRRRAARAGRASPAATASLPYGKTDDARRAAALQAQQALEVRLVERQREAARDAMPPARRRPSASSARGSDDDEQQRQRDQMDPRRGRRAGGRVAVHDAQRGEAGRVGQARSPTAAPPAPSTRRDERVRAPRRRGTCSPSRRGSRARGRARTGRRRGRARAPRRRRAARSRRAAAARRRLRSSQSAAKRAQRRRAAAGRQRAAGAGARAAAHRIGAHERPRRHAARGARSRASGQHDQQHVDDRVPRQHAPERRREQVDALAAADRVGGDAEREGDQRDRRPIQRAVPARLRAGTARAPARAGARRCSAWRRASATNASPARSAARPPRARRGRPRRRSSSLQLGARRLRGLERLEQVTSRARRSSIVAAALASPLRPARARSGSSARRSCLRRSGRRERRGRCARPGSR